MTDIDSLTLSFPKGHQKESASNMVSGVYQTFPLNAFKQQTPPSNKKVKESSLGEQLYHKLSLDPLLANLIEKNALDRFMEIEKQMQKAKDRGDTQKYAKLQN